MRKRILIVSVSLLLAAVLALAGYIANLYRQGSESNYNPPKPPTLSHQEQVTSDLQNLSHAVEAYLIKNMEYPRQLEALVPEFVERVGQDPLSGKPYQYTVNESAGGGRYRISVPDPARYHAKELFIENGTFVKQ